PLLPIFTLFPYTTLFRSFSQHWIRKIIVTITLVAIVIVPALQFSPRLIQGASQTYAVAIVDYAFQTLYINITTGTKVVWTYASKDRKSTRLNSSHDQISY